MKTKRLNRKRRQSRFFDYLPDDILLIILGLAVDGKYENIFLKLTCKKWNQKIDNTRHISMNDRLFNSAFYGYEARCYLVIKWGAYDFKTAFQRAALGGHENICRLGKELWLTNFNDMLKYATIGDHENICRLAKKWGATNFETMLADAAEQNNEKLCRLAKEWGAN